jgi:hypothetical protein
MTDLLIACAMAAQPAQFKTNRVVVRAVQYATQCPLKEALLQVSVNTQRS